jgi:23S rRNA (guanine2445-N2)-methyltransferase / 23S rRNA (guanine2069-N7)-methyltransferase
VLLQADAFEVEPPPVEAGQQGLFIVNPPYGERIGAKDSAESRDEWRRLGDLMKQKYAGWRAVVLAGGASQGKHIGLKPSQKIPVKNGPLEAKILVFELY